jgi:hypothetical protein
MRAAIFVAIFTTGCMTGHPLPVVRAVRAAEHPPTLAIRDTTPVKTTTAPQPKTPDPVVKPVVAQEPTQRTVDQLHADAVAKFGEATSFVARLRRKETSFGRPKPEELILFKERKNPYGIHMKWIGDEARGREVLYVRGQYGDRLNIITAQGDVPFTAAGQRMSFARNNPLVRAANPNHDITDAGMSSYLRDLGDLYIAARDPNSGVQVKTLGQVKRNEFPEPVEGVEIKLPPGRDPDVPKGGSRQIFYCMKTKLPVLYLLYDEIGREQNYNCYDRVQTDLPLDDHEFDPDKLWGKRDTPAAAK